MTLQALEAKSHKKVIVFYDGLCNLCNGFVRMVVRQDSEEKILFCPLQDPASEQVRKELGQEFDFTSVIALAQGDFYLHSDVTFLIAEKLGGFWLLLYPLKFIPKKIRDAVYDWVARNRYKWFGKKETCDIVNDLYRGHFIISN